MAEGGKLFLQQGGCDDGNLESTRAERWRRGASGQVKSARVEFRNAHARIGRRKPMAMPAAAMMMSASRICVVCRALVCSYARSC